MKPHTHRRQVLAICNTCGTMAVPDSTPLSLGALYIVCMDARTTVPVLVPILCRSWASVPDLCRTYL